MMRSEKKRTFFAIATLAVLLISVAVVSRWPASPGSITLSGDLSLRSQRLAYRQITPSRDDSERVTLRLTYQLSSDPAESLWLDAVLPARLDAGEYRFTDDALSMRVQRYRNGRTQTTRFSGGGVIYLDEHSDRGRVSGVIEFTATAQDGDLQSRALARAEFYDLRW